MQVRPDFVSLCHDVCGWYVSPVFILPLNPIPFTSSQNLSIRVLAVEKAPETNSDGAPAPSIPVVRGSGWLACGLI